MTKMTKMTGGAVMAEMLKGYGVTHVFHVPTVLQLTMAEVERRTDILRVHAHAEKSAAYMADGYARVSGRPGICMAQVVGALNLAAGLRDAWLARAPVIAMTGGRNPDTKFRGVYQEVDDMPAFEPVTKLNATVDSVHRFPDMVRQAFRAATTGSPGPVHLQFRGNLGQIDFEEDDMEAVVEAAFAQVPPFRPIAPDEHVRAALSELEAAERPVIVAGGGVRASGAAGELVAFAERDNIPVATSLNGKDLIPGIHPLSVGVVGSYSRETANRIVNEADLVCFVGTSTGGMTTHFWQVPPLGMPAIQIDIEPENIGRNYLLKAAVNADAKTTLARMLELANAASAGRRESWVARVAEVKSAYYSKYDELMCSDAAPIRPERICKDLSDHLPDDAIVVADTGHSGMWMGGMYDVRTPSQSYIRSAGHLGWAYPASIGAKCGAPNRPVLCFTGDAGFSYHLTELETAVRYGINTVTLVNNNSSGNQAKPLWDEIYGGRQTEKARELWTFNDVDFVAVADTMGAGGIRVEKATDLPGAITAAFEANRPMVIDVRSDIDAMAPPAVT